MITIANKNFETKKSLEDYIRANIIYNIGLCDSLKTKNEDKFNFMLELFKRHPDYPEKTKDLSDILIVPNKVNLKYFELNMKKNDGSIEDISWRTCVSETRKDEFKSACRVAIEDEIRSFRDSQIRKCKLCGTMDAKEYHVDHEKHFEEILNEFIQNIKKEKPTCFTNTQDNRKTFLSKDKEFEDLWKEFHKSNSKLRILCKSCNLKRPKWKDENVIEEKQNKQNKEKEEKTKAKRIEKLSNLYWSDGSKFKDLSEDVLTALYNSDLCGRRINNLREYVDMVYDVNEIKE